ncbi:hypothetical protein XENTR_v10024836 [Xenopus tropicalis]|uniref:Keratin 18, type I, gene 1 n=1 Tax=Xenopus tropicalis TaxID=8364 RepID=A0A803JE97_XENTR|nr:keratin, type I cytoskeletal 18 [Xenopus tropicalis]KAE8581570.1 hypothetical protein XENTR_v10024836 [Xenopus tropicalis]KAE8581571.1 hypothetical protein XENTR_v10024836 [Xenopus tropicalis]
MALYGSNDPPSRRGSFSSLSGSLAPSRLPSLRGIDPLVLRAGMDTMLPSTRSGMDSLLNNNHQEVMQGLNERLAGYLQRVRSLEEANHKLQDEIDKINAKKSQATRDWDSYQDPLQPLRQQVEVLNMDNAKLLLQIDNARLAADDFKVKIETEQSIADGVLKDTQGLRKMTDDTNFLRMKLEGELETLKEELAHLRKNHKEEVASLQALIGNNNVKVEVEGPKKSDLNESIAHIRGQYEKLAEQNRTDAESAYKKKLDNMSQEANTNNKALDQAKNEVADLRRQLQALEIERQTLEKTVDSLQNALRDTENHYGSNLMDLNQQISRLQEELAACRADIERQVRAYEALLNLKSKLENEIHDYRTLLDGFLNKEEQPDLPPENGTN